MDRVARRILVGATDPAFVAEHLDAPPKNRMRVSARAEGAPRREARGCKESRRHVPHLGPFLLVDSVIEIERGRLVGLKTVTADESFRRGHFPGRPIMPGLLIVEALAQVAALLLIGAVEKPETKIVYFTSVDAVRWHREVGPGGPDRLRLEAEVAQRRGHLGKVRGTASIEGALVREADLGAMVVDRGRRSGRRSRVRPREPARLSAPRVSGDRRWAR